MKPVTASTSISTTAFVTGSAATSAATSAALDATLADGNGPYVEPYCALCSSSPPCWLAEADVDEPMDMAVSEGQPAAREKVKRDFLHPSLVLMLHTSLSEPTHAHTIASAPSGDSGLES